MSKHAVDVIVGEHMDGMVRITVSADGFATHIHRLCDYVCRAEGVKTATVVDRKSVIIASCELVYRGDSTEQVRIRIRNRCRDYFHSIMPQLTNAGSNAIYVDLEEHAKTA